MLSEPQAKSLLADCEKWLVQKLPRLRKPLKTDHNSTKAHIWELIVLHAVASSIVSRQDKRAEVAPDISSQLQPEPDDATPDVFVHPDGCEPFWIEAAYIMPQQHDADPVRSPGIPKGVEDNAVYKTIRRKIEKQLQRWMGAGKTYQPLVLCIGASEGLYRLNASDIFSLNQLKQAVYSALADIEQGDWVTNMNLTGNRSWPWSMRSQRISGSELISAVVIVTIRNQDSGYGLVRRASRPLIIKNPHPNVELTAEQEQFLNQIDFNQVKYQSGRESWEPPHPKDAPDALNRYRLYEQTRGKYVLEPGPNEAFTIEIPSKIVAQFLAGNITADKVWNSNRLDADNYSNSTLSFKQDIGYFLRLAANNGQQIVNVNFVPGDPKLRDESRIRLEFGKITDPIEPINKNCIRASIESDAKGTFTLKLSTSLLTCLLAGKITADEAWRSENNQKIGDCLKKAVSKRQEIIDAKLIQVDSEFENEPQIILEFSAATDTTIREDKKR